jgi:hypothetical protein
VKPGQHVEFRPQAPTDEELGSRTAVDLEAGATRLNLRALDIPEDYWINTLFEARSDQPNRWTIPIPDELIKAVRARLADNSAAQSKQPDAKSDPKP